MYGCAIDNCKLTGFNLRSSGDVFDMIFRNIDTDYKTTSNISSDSLGVCLCKNNQPVCKHITQLEVYPGETFHVSVLAVGQRAGTVSTTVRSNIVLGQVDLQPAVMYITYLEYPTYNRRVWLYDANIDYLSGKHIPLFIVAVLFFIFLFLPYTLLLLFGQWLQALSHLKLFSWVTSARLKPFMDSYHAPYKPKHRYWSGLLLVLRFVFLLVFDTSPQQNKANPNLLSILVGTGVLQMWAWVSGGVYEKWYLDVLEGSFALNLIILVGTTYYVKLAEGNQLAVGYTSVSIAFVTFTSGFLSFHWLK